MSASVINNSNSNIQVYIICSDSIGTIDLKNIFTADVTFIGAGSNADLTILGDCIGKKYIIVQIWRGNTSSGEANSIAVYDTTTNAIIKKNAGNFNININKNTKGYQVVIENTPSSILPSILIFMLIIMLMVIFSIAGYFLVKYLHSQKSYSSPYSSEDIPILNI